MTIKTTEDVQFATDQLGFDIDGFLRERGWEYKCDTPGSYWLWERMVGSRTILVQRDMAVRIEAALSRDWDHGQD